MCDQELNKLYFVENTLEGLRPLKKTRHGLVVVAR